MKEIESFKENADLEKLKEEWAAQDNADRVIEDEILN